MPTIQQLFAAQQKIFAAFERDASRDELTPEEKKRLIEIKSQLREVAKTPVEKEEVGFIIGAIDREIQSIELERLEKIRQFNAKAEEKKTQTLQQLKSTMHSVQVYNPKYSESDVLNDVFVDSAIRSARKSGITELQITKSVQDAFKEYKTGLKPEKQKAGAQTPERRASGAQTPERRTSDAQNPEWQKSDAQSPARKTQEQESSKKPSSAPGRMQHKGVQAVKEMEPPPERRRSFTVSGGHRVPGGAFSRASTESVIDTRKEDKKEKKERSDSISGKKPHP